MKASSPTVFGQLQRRIQRQRAFEPGQCGLDRFTQRQVPLAHEVQEIGAGKPVSMREYAAPHDVEQGVGEVPAGDQVVRGLLESIGTAGQPFQASGTGRDILFDGTGWKHPCRIACSKSAVCDGPCSTSASRYQQWSACDGRVTAD